MGHEILYCSVCAERILGADLEKGKAVRSGHQAACSRCAPEFRKTHPVTPPPEPPPRQGSETRTPLPTRRSGSTVRMPMVPASSGGPSVALLVGGGLVLAAFLVVGVLLVGGRSASTPAPQAPEARAQVRRTDPVQPPPPPGPEPGRMQAAEKAVLAARAATAAGEVEAAFEAWDAALRAADRTSWNAEASTGYQAAAERRRLAWKASLDEAEKEIRASAERGDATAWKGIVARLRLKHRGAEWTAKVNDLGARSERAAADLAEATRAERPWTSIFDGKTVDCLRLSCRDFYTVSDGAIVFKVKGSAAQTSREMGDGEYRIRFEMQGLEQCFFAVQQGVGAWRVVFSGERVRGVEGGVRELLIVTRGGSGRATLDGQEVPVSREGNPRIGAIQFNGEAKVYRILALDYRE